MRKKFQSLFVLGLTVLLFTGAGCFSLGGEEEVKYTGPGGMYLSTDKGESWKSINNYPTAEGVKNLNIASVYKMETDPSDPEALYWQSRERGFFYSYNAGQTWQRPLNDLQKGRIYSLSVHPEDTCTIFATDGRRIMRTSDCSRHWEEVYTHIIGSEFIRELELNPFDATEMTFITDKYIYRSEDNGISWRRVGDYYSQGGLADILYDPNNEGIMYMARKSKGLYRSEDGGESFTRMHKTMKGFEGALTFRRMSIHPSKKDTLFWVSDYGIMRSEDKGDTWTAYDLITPPKTAKIYTFAVNPKNDREIYYTGTVNDRSYLYKSVDGGRNWITEGLPSGQIPTHLHIDVEEDNKLYLGFTIVKE